MADIPVTTGAIIRSLRKKRGWSLQDLSDRTGLSRSHLGKIETGKTRASVAMLTPIAAAFGIDPQLLVPQAPRASQTDCTKMLATLPPGIRTAFCNLIFAYHVGL
jgi:transcriptional regulator with XRE-family HTH domain